MTNLLTNEHTSWIGRCAEPSELHVSRRDIVKYSLATEQTQAKYLAGDEAPPMFLFGAWQPLRPVQALREDGLRPDALLPPLPLSRTMAGGVKQSWRRPVRADDTLTINRKIINITEKQGKSGPLIFIEYQITFTDINGELVMQEHQTRIAR